MRVSDSYPFDTVAGACIVTGRGGLEPGERVIDTELNVDRLPPHGRICVSESGIQEMNALLGYGDLEPLRRVIRSLNLLLDEAGATIGELRGLNRALMVELTAMTTVDA